MFCEGSWKFQILPVYLSDRFQRFSKNVVYVTVVTLSVTIAEKEENVPGDVLVKATNRAAIMCILCIFFSYRYISRF